MLEDIIKPQNPNANLNRYAERYRNFQWSEIEAEFTWAKSGKLNIGHEAIDVHAARDYGDSRYALIMENSGRKTAISYREMRVLSNRAGNVLRRLGVKKGDRVFLFLPMLPELYIALAATAKIGAVAAPLYHDFQKRSVKARLLDGGAKVVVTVPEYLNKIPFYELPELENILVVGGVDYPAASHLVSWEQAMAQASENLELEWVSREDFLLLFYTGGERPLGLLQSHDAMLGYLASARWVLDLNPTDTLWTAALPGWLMNMVYGAFAPWLCGVNVFHLGEIKTAEDVLQAVQKYRVSVLYATPTVYRTLLSMPPDLLHGYYDLTSLRLLASALEPLDPDLLHRIKRLLGLSIHDTWWNAETGMIALANFPSEPIHPGYMGKPLPGITATILDENGEPLPPFTMGYLALKTPWPAMTRYVWGNPERYAEHLRLKPWFIFGDIAYRDFNGYFYHQGRSDTLLVTAGGYIGLSEVERLLRMHPAVEDTAVIRRTGGRGLKAFVELKSYYRPSELLAGKLMAYVAEEISPDLGLSEVEFRTLPRGAGGRPLRRVLKAWDLGLPVGNIANLKDE